MYIIYGICTFILSSSSIMIGYVWVRDIKNTRAQAANIMDQGKDSEETQPSEDILAEYPNLIKRTA